MIEVWNKLSTVLKACFLPSFPILSRGSSGRGEAVIPAGSPSILLQDWQDLLAQFYLIKSMKSQVLIGQLAGLPVYQAQGKQPPLSAWGSRALEFPAAAQGDNKEVLVAPPSLK